MKLRSTHSRAVLSLVTLSMLALSMAQGCAMESDSLEELGSGDEMTSESAQALGTGLPENININWPYITFNAGSEVQQMRVFFKTTLEDSYSDDKSKVVRVPYVGSKPGSSVSKMTVLMADNLKWRGTLTGLRIEPLHGLNSTDLTSGQFRLGGVGLSSTSTNTRQMLFAYNLRASGWSLVHTTSPTTIWTILSCPSSGTPYVCTGVGGASAKIDSPALNTSFPISTL